MEHEKRDHEDYSDEWLAKLDAVATGGKAPMESEDELLSIAERLYTELAPLREMGHTSSLPLAPHPQGTPIGANLSHTPSQDIREGYPYHERSDSPGSLVHGTDTPRGYPGTGRDGPFGLKFAPMTGTPRGYPGAGLGMRLAARLETGRFARATTRVAPTVVLLVLVLIVSIASMGGLTALWGSATSLWHTSTSLDQLQGLSVASLPRPHAGIAPLPLLPAALPGDTQAATYGVITDTGNPNLLITFVADYHIAGQDVLLYEQPSDIPFSTSSAKTVQIGTLEGHIFQDDTGTSALQWYEQGMACQLTSTLGVSRLVELASKFQPLKSWELIL